MNEEDGPVLSSSLILTRLRSAALAAASDDEHGLTDAAAWLERLSASDLIRTDSVARMFRYDGPTLGTSKQWTRHVLESSDAATAFASMHRDGYVRECSLRLLSPATARLGHRMVALRVRDHVPQVRTLAVERLMAGANLASAAHIMPVLHRFERGGRGADTADAYLRLLIERHGADQVWRAFRTSTDRDVRRWAFRRSIDGSFLGIDDALALWPRERDQVVRRLLALVIADGDPETIRATLLRGRAAEHRALALVRLQPADLTNDEVRPLLADSSSLVRLWARRRWQELGGNAERACRELVDAATAPSLRARAYAGLSEAGGRIERAEILALVRDPDAVLQRAGLQLLAPAVTADDVADLLRLVRSSGSRVAQLAVDCLSAHPTLWSLRDVEALRADPDPEIRRRAWVLHHSRGRLGTGDRRPRGTVRRRPRRLLAGRPTESPDVRHPDRRATGQPRGSPREGEPAPRPEAGHRVPRRADGSGRRVQNPTRTPPAPRNRGR
ncbi:MAG: hypothetical protein QM713_13150 [Arachnia sp.]